MKVWVEPLPLATLVIPEGRLDFGAAPDFQQQIEALLAGTPLPPAVIVDCAALDYVSSAGLRVFLLAARAAQRTGVWFGLCTLKPAVRDVFDLSGFSRIIAVHADRSVALAQVPQKAGVTERRTAVPSDAAQLPVLMQFIQEFWSAAKIPQTQAMPFELALEEVFTNIVKHGSPAGTVVRVEVSLVLIEHTLTMTVVDDGPPFDPRTVPPPDVAAGLGERPLGGHGVHLVRQMMDEVNYQRAGARNQLRMTKRMAPK